MRRHRAFRLTIDDATRLERVASVRLTPAQMVALGVALLTAMIIAGSLLVMLTPIKRLMPGFMNPDQRAQTEERLLRLDSLTRITQMRDAWLANVLRVLDADRLDSPAQVRDTIDRDWTIEPDSLIGSSPRERRFVASMREREKYNISVLAPLASTEMTFVPPSPRVTVPPDARDALVAVIPLSPSAPVVAMADGSVVAAYRAPMPEAGVVIMQHDHGFVSAYTGLQSLTVSPGDRLNAGQTIALHATRAPDGSRPLTVRLWHDSDPVTPYRYFNDDR